MPHHVKLEPPVRGSARVLLRMESRSEPLPTRCGPASRMPAGEMRPCDDGSRTGRAIVLAQSHVLRAVARPRRARNQKKRRYSP
jgi:hypothetical protein